MKLLSDGAHKMCNLLHTHLPAAVFGKVEQGIDFWARDREAGAGRRRDLRCRLHLDGDASSHLSSGSDTMGGFADGLLRGVGGSFFPYRANVMDDSERQLLVRQVGRSAFAEMVVGTAAQKVGPFTRAQHESLVSSVDVAMSAEADTVRLACAEIVRKHRSRLEKDPDAQAMLDAVIKEIEDLDPTEITMQNLISGDI